MICFFVPRNLTVDFEFLAATDQNNKNSGITAKDVWKILEGVKRGSFHVQVGWSDLTTSRVANIAPLPSMSKCEGLSKNGSPGSMSALHRGVLSIYVDSCFNLLAMGSGDGRSGTHREQLRNLRPLVKAELCGVSHATEIAIGGENPVFEHKVGDHFTARL